MVTWHSNKYIKIEESAATLTQHSLYKQKSAVHAQGLCSVPV